jgi:hypothetical protein
MNKFKKNEKFYYMMLNRICYSKVINYKVINGEFIYEDNYFDNIKECYMFKTRKELLDFQNKIKKL